jgi:purine nucleoside phosphorylase
MTQLACLKISHRQIIRTPYGEPSGPLTFGSINDNKVVFLARHGYGQTIPPHEVNYRANLWFAFTGPHPGLSRPVGVNTPRSDTRRGRGT